MSSCASSYSAPVSNLDAGGRNKMNTINISKNLACIKGTIAPMEFRKLKDSAAVERDQKKGGKLGIRARPSNLVL